MPAIVEHGKDYKVNLIRKLGEGPEQRIIDKSTPGAIIGTSLTFKVPGSSYTIFSSVDDIVYIDDNNETVFIGREANKKDKVNKPLLTPVTERRYLLLPVYLESEDVDGSAGYAFFDLIGRQSVFDWMVENASLVDLFTSRVMAETTKLNEAASFFDFLKMCVKKELVNNPTDFDPDEYYIE